MNWKTLIPYRTVILALTVTISVNVTAQIKFGIIGETSLNHAGLKQGLGLNLQKNRHSNQLLFGVDRILSATSKPNLTIGYYYSFISNSSFLIESGINLKLGEMYTSFEPFLSHVAYCRGKYLFEESIGFGYVFKLTKIRKMDITAFTRFGFIYGHTDILNPFSGTKCNEPIIVVIPQVGMKYQWNMN